MSGVRSPSPSRSGGGHEREGVPRDRPEDRGGEAVKRAHEVVREIRTILTPWQLAEILWARGRHRAFGYKKGTPGSRNLRITIRVEAVE